MKTQNKIFWLMLFVLSLSACATGQMTRKDMFVSPKFGPTDPIQYAFWTMPDELEYGDTAVIQIEGKNVRSFSWKCIVFSKDTDGKTKRNEFIATRVIEGRKPKLVPQIPGSFKLNPDDIVVVSDHGATVMFDQAGLRLDQDYTDYDPFDKKSVGFGTKIDQAGFRTAESGSPEHAELLRIALNDFRKATKSEVDKIYQELGIPMGSPLTEEQLDEIDRRDLNWWLKKIFISDWKAAIVWTSAGLDGGASMFSVVIFKAFTIYEEAWKRNFEKSGYMRGPATREDYAHALTQYRKNQQLENGKNTAPQDFFTAPLPKNITESEWFKKSACSQAATMQELMPCMMQSQSANNIAQ